MSSFVQDPSNNLKQAVDGCVATLQQKGYLQQERRKTVKQYGLDSELLGYPPESWMLTENHPCIVLGECLPFDFQNFIMNTRNGWYEQFYTHGAGTPCSFMGHVYRGLHRFVERQLCASVVYEHFCPTKTLLDCTTHFPSDILVMIQQYVLAPASLLHEFVYLITPIVSESFQGVYNVTVRKDDRMNQYEWVQLKVFKKVISMLSLNIVSITNQKEQEIQLLGIIIRNDVDPYKTFRTNLLGIYDAIHKVCTILNDIRNDGF